MGISLRLLPTVGLLVGACQGTPPPEVVDSVASSPGRIVSQASTPQPDPTLVLDTLAILTNRRLPELMQEAQRTRLDTFASARVLPAPVATFFHRLYGEPWRIADVGKPYESTDAIADEALPRRQLVYLGVGQNLVLLSYYQGGIGLTQHVTLFQLRADTIQDVWNGTVQGDPRTKAALLRQVGAMNEWLHQAKLPNYGGLYF